MDRRLKAGLIAFLAVFVLVVGVHVAGADDEWWFLRLICAPYEPWSAMWFALGCWQLPAPQLPCC